MKVPKTSPDIQGKLAEILSDEQVSGRILQASREAFGDGKYLHWDKLLYRKPPHDLTHEQWWAALKLARMGLLRPLPLLDKAGQPFNFGQPDPINEYLRGIDLDAGGYIETQDSRITNSDTRDRYVIRSLVEEAITSSQIEGAATTRLVAKDMIRRNRPARDVSEQMILNNYAAMQAITKLKDEELSPRILLDLHQVLVSETLENPSAAGRFRLPTESVEVVDMYDQVYHVAPKANQLESRVAAMCDFANGKTPGIFIHPVVRSIILHFWLAHDHPFVDGNGRCARALFYWSMLRHKYWLCEFISISEIIRKGPAEYGRAFLYCETDDNDLTYFILYHLDIIRKAIDQLHRYVRTKSDQARMAEELIRSLGVFNHRQLALLSHAIRHLDAEYTIISHRTSHDVTYQTARTDLQGLVNAELLNVRKIGRTFCYRAGKQLMEFMQAGGT